MPNPVTVEPRVEAALMNTFNNIEIYLLDMMDELHEDAGLLVSDEFNLTTMEQTLQSLRARMEVMGFQNARQVELQALQELHQQVLQESKKWKTGTNVDPAFAQASDVQIGLIMQGAERELIQVADLASAEVSQIIQRSVLGGSSQSDLIKSVMTQLKIREDQALTLARTSLHSFNSFTTAKLAESVGVEEFSLQGPNELRSASVWTPGNVIREWDWNWEGRRGTWAEYEATAHKWGRDKQPPGIKVWRGGWNCRHYWRPVFASEYKDFPKGPRT